MIKKKGSIRNLTNILIEIGIRIKYPKNLELGSFSYFGFDCEILASEFSR